MQVKSPKGVRPGKYGENAGLCGLKGHGPRRLVAGQVHRPVLKQPPAVGRDPDWQKSTDASSMLECGAARQTRAAY